MGYNKNCSWCILKRPKLKQEAPQKWMALCNWRIVYTWKECSSVESNLFSRWGMLAWYPKRVSAEVTKRTACCEMICLKLKGSLEVINCECWPRIVALRQEWLLIAFSDCLHAKLLAYNSSFKASGIACLLKNKFAWNQRGIDYVSIW